MTSIRLGSCTGKGAMSPSPSCRATPAPRRFASQSIRCKKRIPWVGCTRVKAIDTSSQEMLSTVATTLVAKSQAVLREKVESYTKQLREVEADSDRNIFYRLLNGYTERLLQRKIDFCQERLATMSQLEAGVEACTLDGKCTFELRRIYSQDSEAENVQPELQDMSFLWLPDVKKDPKAMFIEKRENYNLADFSWTNTEEARDLEETLSAAYKQAESIPGAAVSIYKEYTLAAMTPLNRSDFGDDDSMSKLINTIASETKDQGLAEALQSEIRNNSEDLSTSNLPLVVLAFTIIVTAGSTWAASAAGWVLGLDDPLRYLHWEHLIPRSFNEASAIIVWTLPLTVAYTTLAAARNSITLSSSSPPSPFVAALISTADLLETNSRTLFYTQSSTRDDMRILYILQTMISITFTVPWALALAPSMVISFSSLWDGPSYNALAAVFANYMHYDGSGARVIGQAAYALPAAAFVASWMSIGEAYKDKTNSDEKGDETKFMDDLFQFQGEYDQTRNKISEDEAKEMVRQSIEREQENPGSSVDLDDKATAALQAQTPSSITMDFLSASKQKSLNKQEQWVRPVVLTVTTFYLIMEVLVTHQVTAAVISQFVAITSMDLITKPWDQCTTRVRVAIKPDAVPSNRS